MSRSQAGTRCQGAAALANVGFIARADVTRTVWCMRRTSPHEEHGPSSSGERPPLEITASERIAWWMAHADDLVTQLASGEILRWVEVRVSTRGAE